MAKDKGGKSGGGGGSSSSGGSKGGGKGNTGGSSRSASTSGAGAGRGSDPRSFGGGPSGAAPSGGGAGAGRGSDPRNFGGGGGDGGRNDYGNVSITGTKGGPGGGDGGARDITSAIADSGMVGGFAEGPNGPVATTRDAAAAEAAAKALAANPAVQAGLPGILGGAPANKDQPAPQGQQQVSLMEAGKRQFEQTLPSYMDVVAPPDAFMMPGIDPKFDPRYAGIGYGPDATTAQIAELYQYGGPSVGVYGSPNNPAFNSGPPTQTDFPVGPGNLPTGFTTEFPGISDPVSIAPSVPVPDASLPLEYGGLPDYMTNEMQVPPSQSRVTVPSMGASPGYSSGVDPSIQRAVSGMGTPTMDLSPTAGSGYTSQTNRPDSRVATPEMSAPPTPPTAESAVDRIREFSDLFDQVLPAAPPGGVVGDIPQSVFASSRDFAPPPTSTPTSVSAPVSAPAPIPDNFGAPPPTAAPPAGISAADIAANTAASAQGIPPGSFAPMGGGLLAGAVNLVNPLGQLTEGPGFLPPSDPFTMDDFIAQQNEMDRGPENRMDLTPEPAPAEPAVDPSVTPSEKPAWWPDYLPWPPEPGSAMAQGSSFAPPPVRPFQPYQTSYGGLQSAISGAGNPLMMGIGGMVRRT